MKKFLIFIALLIVFTSAVVFLWIKNTAPKYIGEFELEGIADSTQIVYDDFGVPHIYAKNGEDAYFALGYAHAQERLFQMELLRRLANGELSEILGPKLISTDKKMRTLGFNEMSKRNADAFFNDSQNGEMQKLSLSYIKGINSFIENGQMPIEFTLLGFTPEEFEPSDIYSSLGFMALGFTTALTTEPIMQYIAEQLGEDYAEVFESDSTSGSSNYRPYSVKEIIASNISSDLYKFPYDLPLPYWEGSNAWLLSKSKTKSGRAIFANDTHIGYSQPSVWFEAYMEYPGFHMYGYYLAGIPFAIIGHNNDIAWGLTIFPLDNMDLYYETINPNNPKQYKQGDEWKDFEIIKQEIKVKDSASVMFEIKLSSRGPILNNDFQQVIQGESQKVVSLWWTPMHVLSKSLHATYDMNNAKNIVDFEKAMADIDILGLNVMYADKQDNIAWWSTGLLPNRDASLNSKLYMDGATDTLPHTFYSFEKNPRLINPAKGYIITANNSPGIYDSVSISGYYAPGYRAERIEELLNQQAKWDIDDLKAIHMDNFSHRDFRIRDIFMSQLAIDELASPLLINAAKALEDWDGNYNIESVGATIFTRMIYFSLEVGPGEKLGDERFQQLLHTYTLKNNLERLINDQSSVWWTGKRKLLFNLAFEKTVESLSQQLGNDISKWQWGEVHQLEHVHPIGRKEPFDKIFNVGPFPKSGSLEVVDKEGFVYSDKATYTIKSGPAMRCLLDFATPDSAIGIIPTGQSGNIMSPHYSDQAQMFVDGKYRQHIISKDKLNEAHRSLWLLPVLEEE